MTNKVKVAFWLQPETKEKLRKLAKKEYRTMSVMNERILEQYLKIRKR